MLVQSVFLSVCLLSTVLMTVSAFDSTEIRLLEWPRGPKAFTKRSDILDMGVIGPLARFRKSENMGRMVRNIDIMKNPVIRFGKRSGAAPIDLQRLARAYRLQVPDSWQ